LDEVQDKWICGFWTRIGALLVDSLILGSIGVALGFFFESTFVQIGSWGKLIGFSIAMIYFGMMNSAMFNGQTFGKKAFKIKVVDASNQVISVPKSMLRYSILAVPFFVNGAQIHNDDLLTYLIYLFSILLFGGFFAIIYLYVFNRATRQSLHDLVVGTYVVNASASPKDTDKVWKLHLILVSGVFIMAGLAPAFVSNVDQSEQFKSLLSTQEALNSILPVKYVGITDSTKKTMSTNAKTRITTYVKASVYLNENVVDDRAFAEKLAQVVANTYPDSTDRNLIQVTLIYGYDIGIWSLWYSHGHLFNPIEVLFLEDD